MFGAVPIRRVGAAPGSGAVHPTGGSATQPPEAVFMGCVWTRPEDRSLSYLPSHPGKPPVPCVRRGAAAQAQPPEAVFMGCVWTRPEDRPLSYLPSHPGKHPVPCISRGRGSAGTTARGGFYGMCVDATRDGPRSYQLLQPQRFLTQILKIVGTYPFTARKKYLSLYR